MSADTVIDYYFAPMSGYAYLGHARFLAIAADAGAQVRFRPLDMAKVFAAAGSFPPAKYPAVRQIHRKADMRRWAKLYGLPLNDTPAFWPAPMALACEVIVAADHAGLDQGAVSHAILSAVWVHHLNIADPADLAKALELYGIDPSGVLPTAQTQQVKAKTRVHTDTAIELGIFGSPTYVIEGEWFFGQDRLHFLAEHLGATYA